MGALFEPYKSLFLHFDFSLIREGSSRICLLSWFLWFLFLASRVSSLLSSSLSSSGIPFLTRRRHSFGWALGCISALETSALLLSFGLCRWLLLFCWFSSFFGSVASTWSLLSMRFFLVYVVFSRPSGLLLLLVFNVLKIFSLTRGV
jgi:hypothetical protein